MVAFHFSRTKLAIVLLCAFLCAHALADPSSDKRAIAAQYFAWQKAYRANDTAGLLKLLATDFEIVTSSGKRIARATYKKSLLSRRSSPKDYAIAPTKIVIAGRNAKVWSSESLTEKGALHRHAYLDLWRKTRGVWLMVRSTTLNEN